MAVGLMGRRGRRTRTAPASGAEKLKHTSMLPGRHAGLSRTCEPFNHQGPHSCPSGCRCGRLQGSALRPNDSSVTRAASEQHHVIATIWRVRSIVQLPTKLCSFRSFLSFPALPPFFPLNPAPTCPRDTPLHTQRRDRGENEVTEGRRPLSVRLSRRRHQCVESRTYASPGANNGEKRRQARLPPLSARGGLALRDRGEAGGAG